MSGPRAGYERLRGDESPANRPASLPRLAVAAPVPAQAPAPLLAAIVEAPAPLLAAIVEAPAPAPAPSRAQTPAQAPPLVLAPDITLHLARALVGVGIARGAVTRTGSEGWRSQIWSRFRSNSSPYRILRQEDEEEVEEELKEEEDA